MAAGIKGSLSANTAFARQLKDAVDEVIAREAQKVADDAARRADLLVSKLYVTDRSGDRRRPGRHLLGSFRGEVTRVSGPNAVTISLKSSAPGAKVNSLNYGSAPHEITGDLLAFPRTNGGTATRNRANARARRFGGGERTKFARGQVVVESVSHPGTRGTHFLETALEQAISGAYHKSVRIPR